MKKILSKFFWRVLNDVIGQKRLQHFYEYLFRFSQKGLGYGNGMDFNDSGELNVFKYVKEKFKYEKKITIFDVGGNVGLYSLALYEFFKNDAVIHTFEASKITFQKLTETTQNIKQIINNNLGISDLEQVKLLYTNKDCSGLASIYNRKLDHFGISLAKTEEIKLTTIDGYCTRNKIERIHFLKLDIEGHEVKALEGAKQLINNKKIDFIQFEFGGCNIDSRTYFQDFYYLLKENYKIYRILKNELFEITCYKEIYEVFITVNYLAILK
jgi:FkbM family methyltransferase